MTFSSDSHAPAEVGWGYEKTVELARRCGVFNFRRTWPPSPRATSRMRGGSCRSLPAGAMKYRVDLAREPSPIPALLELDERPAIVT